MGGSLHGGPRLTGTSRVLLQDEIALRRTVSNRDLTDLRVVPAVKAPEKRYGEPACFCCFDDSRVCGSQVNASCSIQSRDQGGSSLAHVDSGGEMFKELNVTAGVCPCWERLRRTCDTERGISHAGREQGDGEGLRIRSGVNVRHNEPGQLLRECNGTWQKAEGSHSVPWPGPCLAERIEESVAESAGIMNQQRHTRPDSASREERDVPSFAVVRFE
jgi:hypothetical protein